MPLAFALAAAYIVVAGTAGYLTLPPPRATAAGPATAQRPTTDRTTTTTGTTTTGTTTAGTTTTESTTTTTRSPDQRVNAPGGLTTTIPADWTITTGTVATTLVATDPTSPRRELRLGGAPVTDPGKSLLERITEAATAREREPGHRRVALAATTIRDHPAVTWEFDEDATSGPKRVATAYWEADGVEYVLYSAGPPEEWDQTRARLTRMTDSATP
ncbi:MAG: hypothetical protein HOV94_02445 [Saccharothrix sp.]|nr:hypothetical protein [Saccharothrix sp.]